MSEPVITASGLGKRYRIGGREPYLALRDALANAINPAAWRKLRTRRPLVWALRDISFAVERGEVVGIVGNNGAGKSTLLKILTRITVPTEGSAELRGRVGSLLEVGTGFHPELTGRENIYLNGAILGMRKTEIDRKFDAIVEFSEVSKFLDTPIKHYSSGMYIRLAFAVAAHLETEILLVDEVLAVGDAGFQKKCLNKLDSVAREGRTILFVSHNMGAIRRLCGKGIWIQEGRIAHIGPAGETIDRYLASFENDGSRQAGFFDLSSRNDRSGNGKIRFKTVRLIGDGGEARDHFEFYEPFEIEFEIECERKMPSFFVGFSILSSDGTTLFSSHHPDTAALREAVPGKAVLSCRLEPNQLKPGEYMLQMGIADFATWESYDWFYSIGRLTIESGSGKYSAKLDGRPGYLHPMLEWKWRGESS